MLDSRAPSLIGEAPAFLALLEQVSRAAPLDRPVLVIGERGTGKELIAARLHYLSRRWDAPFVQVNCAALSDELLDSELFGHEAGAFTGASRRHAGRFERADGGTLFLDEIATASLRVQEKLLRAIEYGQFERLGGETTLTADVRVIAATNVDLPALASEGRFRADLLDRLSFEVLTLPPLRHRQEDIPVLAEHFALAMINTLSRDREEAPGPFPGFTDAASRQLLEHDWPGNVRELKNVVERAVSHAPRLDRPIARIVLDPFDSPFRPRPQPATPTEAAAGEAVESGDFQRSVRAYERRLLDAALEATRHNRRQTAERLGLTYDQLRTVLRRHGL